jgi:uncharacterized protein YjiS (DUF1127 family)
MTVARHLPRAEGLLSTTRGAGLPILQGLRDRLALSRLRARQRRELVALLRCDDHILKDVGLPRHEVLRELAELDRV